MNELPKTFRLVNLNVKRNCLAFLSNLPVDESTPLIVDIRQQRRGEDSSAKFHAICHDVAEQSDWIGKKLKPEQWKVLFVSGHKVATGEQAEIVPGMEGEWVNIRESTAKMSQGRMSSLIEYTLAWCADKNIKLKGE